jgi:hypothetical protein
MCRPTIKKKSTFEELRNGEKLVSTGKNNEPVLEELPDWYPNWLPPKSLPSCLPVNSLKPNAILLLLCLPPFYLNHFYTTYYNAFAIFYFVTFIEPLRRFIIVQGISVCAGWYAVMAHDYIHYGRVAHILYLNMPATVKSFMVDENNDVFYTPLSMFFMAGSHISDTFCHPGIALIMYFLHRRAGGTLDQVFTARILAAGFVVARCWSLMHSLYHDGKISFWYIGKDVYFVKDLKCFDVAYRAEFLSYVCMAGYNLYHKFSTKMQKKK